MNEQLAAGIDGIISPEVIEDPYPFYHRLLRENPVCEVPGTGVYLVSSWQLIHQVLGNQGDFSANLTGVLVTAADGRPEMFDLAQFGGTVDAIANADEPMHAVHRKLVLPQLNARRVAAMESEVRDWARQRIDRLLRGGGGDCVAGLADPIPVMVMARLTGLPVEDLPQLLGWAFSGGEILAGTCTLQEMASLAATTSEMVDYLRRHFAQVLAADATAPPENVMDELAVGVRQELISEHEAVAILVVLVGAAGESTSSLVGSAIRVLAQNLPLQQQLRCQPGLLDAFIEEVVRLESPFKGHYRVVLNDVRLGSVTVPAGSRLFLLWAAANRDSEVFAEADKLSLQRNDNRHHLGFGHGIHFCIGARLARLETRIILEELLKACPTFCLDERHQFRHVSSIFVRRLHSLHLCM